VKGHPKSASKMRETGGPPKKKGQRGKGQDKDLPKMGAGDLNQPETVPTARYIPKGT